MATPLSCSPEEYADYYCSTIFQNIRDIMEKKAISQISLARKSGISQPVISKLLNGDTKASLAQIAKICWALGVEPSDILSQNQDALQSYLLSTELATDNNVVCLSPAQSPTAFKGYLGQFNLYFGSTVSSENNILCGTLTFRESADHNSCSAELLLDTGKKTADGLPIQKHYTGTLIISLPMSACYCTLTSKELGEICFLVFNHLFLFNQTLICRMACATTISAGGNRRPTMHRLLICREALDISDPHSDDFKFLHGQLMLNSSDIHITKTAYEEMQAAESKQFSRPEFQTLLEEFQKGRAEDQVYSINEDKIRNAQLPVGIKLSFLSLLREYAISDRYNKISAKVDEHVYNYIKSKARRPDKKK